MSGLLNSPPLEHSWPLFEHAAQFDLGFVHDRDPAEGAALALLDEDALAEHGIGRWHCDLYDDDLTWSAGVFDIFGLPRGSQVSRRDAVTFYGEESRAAMERLRAHAIQHRRGFTLDTRIVPAQGRPRGMRLITMPVCAGYRVIGLRGLKRLIALNV